MIERPFVQICMPLTVSETRIILIGALLAQFLGALDQTVVATALPAISADLGDVELLSWIVTSYLLASTCCMPIVGKLSDFYGRRRMLLLSVAIFTLASMLCAAAPTMLTLILARALQGVGCAGLFTLPQAIIGDTVAPRERGRWNAYTSSVWLSSSLLGPPLGGTLTAHFGWPWIFWINLPLGLIVLAIAAHTLKKLPVVRRRAEIDYASIVLLSGSTIALLCVLSLGGKRLAWSSPALLALALAAVLLGALFLYRQTHAKEPVLPLRFLRDKVIQPVLSASFILYGSYLACIVLGALYFQIGLGLPVDRVGLVIIPMMVANTAASNLAGRHIRHSGRYRAQPMIGVTIATIFFAIMAIFADRMSVLEAMLVLMVAHAGLGPIFPAGMVASQNAVEARDLGAISGAMGFSRALGGAVIVAAGSALVLGLVAASLPELGAVANLEDLVRRDLPPEARRLVAASFGGLFAALAVTTATGLLLFSRVEERTLRGAAPSPAPAASD
jgi:EmrB/QacA subfamily drug resistance transporter